MNSYAKLGFYSDQQSQDVASVSRQMLDNFVRMGFDGVIFEITAGLDKTGQLLDDLTYSELFNLVKYASEKGLETGILTNFNFNNGNAEYVPQSWSGRPLPAEFSLDNAVKSIGDFYNGLMSKYGLGLVDQIYLTQEATDYYGKEYRSYWEDFIQDFRKQYAGQLSTTVFSSNKYVGSVADKVEIWDLLDFMSIWERAHSSESPETDFQDVISSYFESPLTFGSVMDEIQTLSDRYGIPIQMGKNVMSKPDALDGGWDQTLEQATTRPLPTNGALQKTGYEAFLQVVSNNLSDQVSSVFLGNFEPWTYGDWSNIDWAQFPEVGLWETFKYFDLSLFPQEIVATLTTFNYLKDFSYEAITTGSRSNDTIQVKHPGVIYPKGGIDIVQGSEGNDLVVIEPYISEITLRLDIGFWPTVGPDSSSDTRLQLTHQGKIVFDKPISEIFDLANTLKDQWLSEEINVAINPNSDISRPFRFDLNGPGLVQIDVSGVYTDQYHTINDETFSHTNPSSWQRLNWVTQGDSVSIDANPDTAFDLRKIISNSLDKIDGRSGIDTVAVPVIRDEVSISKIGQVYEVSFKSLDTMFNRIQLNNIERLQFSDLSLALDTAKGETAGSAYRIYKAAFDRVPDAGGLGFWINAMDDGASLTSVAAGFISSPEFQQIYGANVTDRDFVTKVYNNVLDRNPDQGGYDFWLGAMGRGATRADILASFSDSPENIGNVADLIANGIQYQAWVG